MSKYWNISSPITVHIEITDACNEKCRHCYNFSRSDSYIPKIITKKEIDYLVNELKKNRVMHVIITGGEPLLALDKTTYLAKRAINTGITVNLNSNLVAANCENMKKIKDIGIDHILTTLHSYKEKVHDYVANTPGAFKKIIKGIKIAQKSGIRVTVNTVLFEFNKDDIYETGKFLYSIGINKFLVNRTIPSPTNKESLKKEFRVGPIEAKKMFSDLIRLREEMGMEIGTCRTVPQCFFDELDKYDEFLARGCAAGKKHLLIDINGESHACVHELKSYGNIYEVSLKKIWQNMADWRTVKYIPSECQKCHLFDICDGGCRLVALAHTGSIKGFDNLKRKTGAKHLPKYNGGIKSKHISIAKRDVFVVNLDFDFRKENGFYIVRMKPMGARIDFINKEICDILIKHHQNKTLFNLKDFGEENLEKLAYFIKRGIVLPVKTRRINQK